MLWKKESALTVRNTTIMTRSRSVFFKIFCSTCIHPQQESRGDPSSVSTLPDTTVYCSTGFPPGNVSCTCIFCLFFCFWLHRVLTAVRASVELRPGASHRTGVSCRRSRAPGPSGARHRLGLTGLVALQKQGLPRPGCEPVSLGLQSRPVTTGAPEQPWEYLALVSVSLQLPVFSDDVIIRNSSA